MNAITHLLLLVALVGALVYSLKINEKIECEKWKSQASEYQGFFLTQWQFDQCVANDIEIQAPVR